MLASRCEKVSHTFSKILAGRYPANRQQLFNESRDTTRVHKMTVRKRIPQEGRPLEFHQTLIISTGSIHTCEDESFQPRDKLYKP